MTDPTADNTIVPLPSSQKITNDDGTPTLFFQRWAQERSIDISNGITYTDLLTFLATVDVIAGVGLSGGGPIDASVTLNLADTAVAPATYGDATHVPQIVIDAQGRITSASNVAISGGGGGGGNTLISNQTLTAVAASIHLSAIPATYTDLIISGNFLNSPFTEVYAQFNGDTSNNYNLYVENRFGDIIINGTNRTRVGSSDPTAAPNEIQIIGYSNTAQPKQVLGIGGYSSVSFIDRNMGTWFNNAAITDILIFPNSGSFQAGTTISLFGR